MLVTFIMFIGVYLGYRFNVYKYLKTNSYLQLACTAFLIFTMGVKLGNRDNLIDELATMGYDSIVLAVLPIVFSIVVVYILSECFLKHKEEK